MMGRAWLLRRLVRLAVLVTMPTSVVVALAHDWSGVLAFLNGPWPPWVSNVANVLQIGSPAIALLAVWLARAARSRSSEPSSGAATRVLRLLALLLPSHDRGRFVGEVTATLVDFPRPWQRAKQLLSVAAAMPGITVILRWARRRRA
jgi:hypothetical protein